MRVACLHTAIGNVAIFENACPDGVSLTHHVRADLLARAQHNPSSAIVAETQALVSRLQQGVDAVLLTCSTIVFPLNPPAFAAEQLVAEELAGIGAGKSVDVLFANPMAASAIDAFFRPVTTPSEMQIRLVPDAWDAFVAGEHDAFLAAISSVIASSEADLVVLAQPLMAPAAEGYSHVLDGPRAALSRIQAYIGA